jgi:hypothetical protein
VVVRDHFLLGCHQVGKRREEAVQHAGDVLGPLDRSERTAVPLRVTRHEPGCGICVVVLEDLFRVVADQLLVRFRLAVVEHSLSCL